ncbi:putative HTH-type transcriptional regulator YjiR [Tritonibacter multivorans]|uniref:Putative HTH-type transcriptional regulator YjiR n=1 Tax=Tritonibacter multivorans TaxID=928856 RepID=A0A0P1GB21_9RHOB|nr:PLP-dependent aminotransferase family protein [Tritonibacter multivorans]MDA7422007.1 PLP-dependent aminotransferase family protein [Tritonibacter multivorans]CUH78674.1 putative HTH-type transcriptional regulator YjiR [Tritonibacter multivorans]SFD66273.1 DNA-binding transcriptional regulator, MocR family, contains an aminotransferase domain [Tritonibacter multivorans]
MENWPQRIEQSRKPRYLAIADCIAQDMKDRVLLPGDQLPPQRKLADMIGVDFTTVSRGYNEALSRGLIETHVGRGTFILPQQSFSDTSDQRRAMAHDLTMNAPPEPTDPELLERMRAGLSAVSNDLVHLLRYQNPIGGEIDKEAASIWLSMRGLVPNLDRIAVTPGAHATMLAILTVLARPGDCILCEDITYAGFKKIAAQLGLRLVGLPMDENGILPDALEAAIQAHQPKALYLNPTLHNPTTMIVPQDRRLDITTVMKRHDLPLIEDDAYGFVLPDAPPPMAAYAPDLTWYIGGLAKCIGAGLRLAYAIAPNARAGFAMENGIRAVSVMASPVSMALATRWVLDGTADQIRRFIRNETALRQQIARETVTEAEFISNPHAFNIWLRLPENVTCGTLMANMANQEIGISPESAFRTSGQQDRFVRICLGGRLLRENLPQTLTHLNNQIWQLSKA